MKMRIIDIIELVDMRNKNLLSDKPMGINIDKYFMPSVANTIGVDLKTYKLVPHNCFACNLMHVGRDERVPMAINKKEDPVLVSPAYLVFRVKESVDVLPDFLMLWFRRPTFDRNAWFFTAGDVRGGLDKKDFFNMEVHVPDIATQRRIVAEYKAVEKRIATNERFIAKLEETAQAIYKKMFVDDINPEHLPDGWRIGSIDEIAKLKAGGDKPDVFSEIETETCNVPIYANSSENEGIFGYTDKAAVVGRSVTITARGTIGYCFLRNVPFFPIVRLVVITPNNPRFADYLYFYYTNKHLEGDGSVQSQLTVPQLIRQQIIIPDVSQMFEFYKLIEPIDSHLYSIKKEVSVLNTMKHILPAIMSK